jgi:hypothetical protein
LGIERRSIARLCSRAPTISTKSGSRALFMGKEAS